MNLHRFIATIRSHLGIVLAIVLVAIAAGFAGGLALPRHYEAQALLNTGGSLNDPALAYSDLLASQGLAQVYARLATSDPVLTQALSKAGDSATPADLAPSVSADVLDQGTLVRITVRDADAARAAGLANAIANALAAQAPKVDEGAAKDALDRLAKIDAAMSQVETGILALVAVPSRTTQEDAQLTSLEGQISALSTARASVADNVPAASTNSLAVVVPAPVPTEPIGTSRLIVLLGSIALGIVLGVSAAFLLASWRESDEAAASAASLV